LGRGRRFLFAPVDRGGALIDYDETGNIGKRYRRQDEIGTPFCFTIDYETLDDQAVTARNRDDMTQERIPLAAVPDWLDEWIA
jgi:glycyl-tRNA synthetase